MGRRVFTYLLVVFTGIFIGVGEICTSSKGLPRVVNKAENIGFTGFRSGYAEDGFKGCYYASVVNVVKGRRSHFAVRFNQSFHPLCDFTGVQCGHFLFDSWENNVRTGIKNPLLNAISGHQIDRIYLLTYLKSVSKFSNDFAGINDLWCQPQRIGLNVLDNYFNGLPFRKGQYPSIYGTRFFIKTMPNSRTS